MPSVTTVRITEHNGSSAVLMPVRDKQQEAVVVDSAVMMSAPVRTGTLALKSLQHVGPYISIV